MAGISVKQGYSSASDARQAVNDIAAAINQPGMKGVLFFCDPGHDLEALGRALRESFTCPVFGCTTAGEILATAGYVDRQLVAVSLASDALNLKTVFIPSLTDFVASPAHPELDVLRHLDRKHNFLLMVIDGLSMLEERIVATLNEELHGLPLIGGSAGDNLDFGHTHVYHDGRFHQNAAVLAHIETTLDFVPFQLNHFEATDLKLVVTEADGATRTVQELNGMPAAEEYASLVGVTVDQLTPDIFAANPVMLRIGGEYFVRSIQKVNSDQSLTFYCAIDTGLVLTLGRPLDIIPHLDARLKALSAQFHSVDFIFASDCILRRLELKNKNLIAAASEVVAPYPLIGFSTYGEQVGGIHVNQTMTGIVIGERA